MLRHGQLLYYYICAVGFHQGSKGEEELLWHVRMYFIQVHWKHFHNSFRVGHN